MNHESWLMTVLVLCSLQMCTGSTERRSRALKAQACQVAARQRRLWRTASRLRWPSHPWKFAHGAASTIACNDHMSLSVKALNANVHDHHNHPQQGLFVKVLSYRQHGLLRSWFWYLLLPRWLGSSPHVQPTSSKLHYRPLDNNSHNLTMEDILRRLPPGNKLPPTPGGPYNTRGVSSLASSTSTLFPTPMFA